MRQLLIKYKGKESCLPFEYKTLKRFFKILNPTIEEKNLIESLFLFTKVLLSEPREVYEWKGNHFYGKMEIRIKEEEEEECQKEFT